jgi:hypothetical protein
VSCRVVSCRVVCRALRCVCTVCVASSHQERCRTFQDARKCTRDHLVAVQERIQTLSKRFPNIIGSHTVSNTTRKGIPALQEALEVEGTPYLLPLNVQCPGAYSLVVSGVCTHSGGVWPQRERLVQAHAGGGPGPARQAAPDPQVRLSAGGRGRRRSSQ